MWMRVDDGLHAHRKTRTVTKSHPSKSRDAAPMGLWILAGSWAAQNGTDGWVPEDELDRFDSEWKTLTTRLVRAGYWWPHKRDDEPGFGFNDWHDYNDPAGAASKAGTFGNHVRWHVNEGRVEPECQHCPTEPDEQEEPPEYRPDIAPESGGDRGAISHPIAGGIGGAIALPLPEPLPEPDPNPKQPSSDKSDMTDESHRFDEFWDVYGKKVKRADAQKKWIKAIRKAKADRIIVAAAAYVTWERENNEGGRYIADPSTWLYGERWRDERKDLPQPKTRVQEHLTLVQQLAAEEAEAEQLPLPQIGYRR